MELNSGYLFIWLALPVSVERMDELPTGITLHQNYPNPFNPSTTIVYEIDQSGTVELAVYNLFGERIAVLDRAMRETGTWCVEYDAAGLSSGVYFAVLNITTRQGIHHTRSIWMTLTK